MSLDWITSKDSHGITRNNNLEGHCAVCGQTKQPTKLYEHVPSIFISEQTGGSQCAPYLTHLDLYLCDTCHTQMLEDASLFEALRTKNTIHFAGCMGHNTVYNRPLR